MEIKDLQYVVAVAEAGSFSAAAERLFVSHQGLSSAIQRLESEIGYLLFLRRGSGGVALSERGHAFYESALPIVFAFREHVKCFSGPEARAAVSVACAFNVVPKCPRPLQRLLLNQDAAYSVETTEHFYSECETLVESGACSFSILFGPFDSKRFNGYTLFQSRQCMIVNRAHPLAEKKTIRISDLRNASLIIPHPLARSNSIFRGYCQKAGFEPNVVLECDRPMEVMRLVKENPELVARMFVEDVLSMPSDEIRMLTFSDIDYSASVCLIEKKKRPLTSVEQQVRLAILNSAVASDE